MHSYLTIADIEELLDSSNIYTLTQARRDKLLYEIQIIINMSLASYNLILQKLL